MTDAVARKPRVVFFLPGLDVGGAERHTIDLRRRFIAAGYDTGLIVYGRRRSPHILAMDGAQDPVLLDRKGMSDLPGWATAWKKLRAAEADVIFAVNQTPAIVAAFLRLTGATRAKIACVFHTTLLRPSETARLPVFKAAARMLDALVYVSRNQQAYWTGRGLRAGRQAAIVNGVDLDRYDPAADRDAAKAALGLAPGDFVIGQLAALRAEKNHVQTVEALAALRADGLSAKAVLVGDGPMRGAVTARAEELGVSDHLVLAGEQGEVRPFIAAFDVGVLTSTSVETFSLAALEVLASGVPMVMSRIGGADEIVADGVNGALFDAGDTRALVAALQRLSDPAVLSAARAAARPSVERLSIDAMSRAYQALADDLAAGR